MTCPNGFVIPDDLNSADNWYPNHTLSECAFRCDGFILFTEEEWQTETLITGIVSYTIFFCLLVVIFVVIVDRRPNAKPRQYGYFMEIFIFVLAVICLVDMIVLSQPVEERLCRNNANFIEQQEATWFVGIVSLL